MQLPGNLSVNINQLFALHKVEIVIYNKITEYICKIVMNVILLTQKVLEENIRSVTPTCVFSWPVSYTPECTS